MKEMRPIVWIALLAVIAAALLFWNYFSPPSQNEVGPVLTKRETKAANAGIEKERQTTASKTKQAEAATQAADRSQATANTSRQQAIHYHIKAQPTHAKPVILSDAVVDSLQLALSNYPN